MYYLEGGSKLYCRTCQAEIPHFQDGPSHMACLDCKRRMSVVEIVATYAADEYSEPMLILLPLRLRPDYVAPHTVD